MTSTAAALETFDSVSNTVAVVLPFATPETTPDPLTVAIPVFPETQTNVPLIGTV